MAIIFTSVHYWILVSFSFIDPVRGGKGKGLVRVTPQIKSRAMAFALPAFIAVQSDVTATSLSEGRSDRLVQNCSGCGTGWYS